MSHLKSAAIFFAAVMLITMAPSHAASHAEAVAAAAQDFLQSLDEEQRATAQLPLDTNERTKWSNLPIIMVQPAGVLFQDLTDDQRRAAHALMRATMSTAKRL